MIKFNLFLENARFLSDKLGIVTLLYGSVGLEYLTDENFEANDGLMAIFAEFAVCKDNVMSADSAEAQALVAKLQAHITENYYTCTDEILAGLGKMYVADERFKKNIDKYGEGTAEFAAEAIAVYCRKA